MRLRPLLASAFAASALALTTAGTLVVAHSVADRAQVRAEARMADLAGQLRQIIDANVEERLGDMAVLEHVARTTASAPEARRTWVEAMRKTYPAYAWIGFADREGRVTASTGGMLEGASVAARPWFQHGLVRPSVTDVHEAKLLANLLPALPDDEPKRFIDVSVPLRDASGAVVGVVGGHLSVAWLREMSRAAVASTLAREPGVEVLVLAGDGTVVLGPGDREGERMRTDLPALSALAAGAERATARGVWPDGRDCYTGASRAQPTAGRLTLPWTVIVREPVEVALAPTRAIVLQLAVGGGAFVLLFALIGWGAAARLAAPVQALADAARDMERSPADARLPGPRGYAEITVLTTALTGLLTRLGERDRALAAANVDLERRVAERTAELVEARDRAEAAQARAEAAERAKGEFLATMSHEIRTPLNGVIGYSDLLCGDPSLSPTARLHAERIRGAGSALLTVVNDVLDFSKIEAGQVEITPRPFALAALLDGALAIVRGAAEAKGLGLTVHVAPGLPGWIEGDHDRLRQILLNLLSNAIKFTAQGWVCLKVESAEYGDGRTRLRFSASDTGIGVPADKRERLFRRFSQVDGSISRNYGGTGLGLAISKALVGLMGGTIDCDSEPGRGSTFWFEVALPIAVPEQSGVALAVVRSPATRVGRRLLLAEDVPLNQELARIILERTGHVVDVVGDGAAAVEAVQAKSYDLVLMDVQMPVLDGVAGTRLIRALDGPAGRVPILAMTANVLPEQIASFLAAGMNGHVGKPFRPDALLEAIDRWAGSRRAPAPARGAVDRATLEDMQGVIGEERVQVLLGQLAEELDRWFGPQISVDDRARLAEGAHAMVSAAGLLGFIALSEACRAVEAACLSTDPHEPALATLRTRVGETIDEIERLQIAC